jgi:hypothetical protein
MEINQSKNVNPFRSYIGPRPTVWFSCSAPMSEDVRHGFCCIFSPGDTACILGKPLRNMCSSHFMLYKFLLTTDASSAQVTLLVFLENHWEICVPHILCSTNFWRFHIIFFQVQANCGAVILLFQVCRFPGMPKLQTEQHVRVLKKTLHSDRMCYSLVSSRTVCTWQ